MTTDGEEPGAPPVGVGADSAEDARVSALWISWLRSLRDRGQVDVSRLLERPLRERGLASGPRGDDPPPGPGGSGR